MKLSKLGEFGLIKILQKKCPGLTSDIITGIGDDAAVVKGTDRNILITSDMLIEGVHFDLSLCTFYQLGYKFLAVNISDIFAMGGSPKYFIVSLGVPGNFDSGSIGDLYSGINSAAGKFDIAVIGGDTCSSKQGLILSGTLTGHADKIITRAGAKEGDGIFVSTTLGDSAMGLHILQKGGRRVRRFSPPTNRLKLIRKHLMPRPAPVKNTSGITAMTDVSDGLCMDLSHICDASGRGAVIYRDQIPISREVASTATSLHQDPMIYALQGGEDYALLFTAPPDYRTKAFRIGEIMRKGRYIVDGKGNKTPFKAEGYEHFKRQRSAISHRLSAFSF